MLMGLLGILVLLAVGVFLLRAIVDRETKRNLKWLLLMFLFLIVMMGVYGAMSRNGGG